MQYRLLDYPTLTCDQCYGERYDDATPLCVKRACPIEDLATDPDVNEAVEKFLMAKALYTTTEDPETQRKIFDELGLYDDPVTHLEAEHIYRQYRNKIQDEHSEARKWRKM